MASEPTEQQCADADYENVVKTGKARRDLRTSDPNALGKAERELEQDMMRLMTSPHTQVAEGHELKLSPSAITALRALWTCIQEIKVLPDLHNIGAEREAALETDVHRTVMSIDPTHVFKPKAAAKDKKAASQELRKSQLLAAKPKKNYQENEEDDDKEDLIGDKMDE